ncbi:MAG: hypothetical protein AAGA85_28155, partial [Bacteroidota bacterium]
MRSLTYLFLLLGSLASLAQRVEVPFNQAWQFDGTSPAGYPYQETIDLPHTWNDQDVQQGIAQHRTTGTYTKRFVVEEAWRG